jgi:lysophospholipase L1-like esterase
VAKGSRIILVVDDAGDTTCDLTDVDLRISSVGGAGFAYVAMGDSYSSGEGSPENTFFKDTVIPDPPTGGSRGCHRSSKAWATNIAATRKLSGDQWKFAACSGGVLNDFFTQRGDEAPQVSHLSDSTKLVTMTIGGNDVGFSKIVADCVFDQLRQRGSPGCRQSGRTAHTTAEDGLKKLEGTMTIGGQERSLADVYSFVAGRIALDGKVVVAQYPRLFASGKAFYRELPLRLTPSCRVGTAHAGAKGVAFASIPVYVSKADADYLNEVLDRGNALIAKAVDKANETLKAQGRPAQVVLADGVNKQFDRDRVCDVTPHLNGVILHGLQKSTDSKNVHKDPDNRSFHPNTDGQSDYARAVKDKLN